MKPMTSARAKMRSTQLEENVSIRVIQYIPAYHTDTESYCQSSCCDSRVRLEVTHLCGARQSQQEDYSTDGEGD